MAARDSLVLTQQLQTCQHKRHKKQTLANRLETKQAKTTMTSYAIQKATKQSYNRASVKFNFLLLIQQIVIIGAVLLIAVASAQQQQQQQRQQRRRQASNARQIADGLDGQTGFQLHDGGGGGEADLYMANGAASDLLKLPQLLVSSNNFTNTNSSTGLLSQAAISNQTAAAATTTTTTTTTSAAPSLTGHSNGYNRNQIACPSGLLTFELSTGFIYKPQSVEETLSMMPSTLQLTDCLDYCLHNSSCVAINFEMGLCVLLAASASQNQDSLQSSQFPVFTIYAEKKCLLKGKF